MDTRTEAVVRPEEVKVGQTHFIHPFRKNGSAGAKVTVETIFGVDMMVRVLSTGDQIMVFFTDLWRGYD
jgi:hypothetical protein